MTIEPKCADRALERLEEKRKLGENRPTEAELADYVAHLEATFDPTTCVSCNLYNHCRAEGVRVTQRPLDVLIEIGGLAEVSSSRGECRRRVPSIGKGPRSEQSTRSKQRFTGTRGGGRRSGDGPTPLVHRRPRPSTS